jgi:hypothetical protein
MPMDLAPHEIDQRIARAAATWRDASRALRKDPDASRYNVLESHRAVTTRSMWIELGERAAKDPLLAAARVWAYALTLERVCWPARVKVADALHASVIEVPDLEAARLSPRTVFERVFTDVEADRRRFYADAFVRGAGGVRDASFVMAERRAEAIRKLGVDDVDALEVPLDPSTSLVGVAERVLEVTEPFVPTGFRCWDEVLAFGLARDAGEGWPSRLSLRWFTDLFAATGLLDGLVLPAIEPPPLLGATSFVRALALFGRVYAETDVSRSAPFVFVRSPFDLRVARRAALFGSLPIDTVFGVRALGLGRVRAADQARRIARALVIMLRLDALRVLLRGIELLSPRVRRERFEEQTARAFGVAFPKDLEFVVPHLGPNDPTRLLGTLLAVADRRSLVERFDEDWFRSPHAALAIRAEQAELPLKKDATKLDALPALLPFRARDVDVNVALKELERLVAELFG